MSGLHSSFSRHMFTLNGNVLTSGGAKNLAKGQFAIVKSSSGSSAGAAVVSNFAGLPKNTPLEIRLGKHRIAEERTARNSKPYSSEIFNLNSVVGVKANFPKFTKQTVDELIIGYDGINDDTAIVLEDNQTTVLDITLRGDHVGFITGKQEYVVKMNFGKEEGETNQEAVLRLVDRLRKQTFAEGVSITEVVNISPIDSSREPLEGSSYVFSTLTLVDDGGSNALAEVQAQYPAYKVVRTSRDGMTSVYTIMKASGASLADFSQTVVKYLKDCEDCAAGYSEIAQDSIVYSITLEDDGTDQSAAIEDIDGYVAASVVKKGNNGGVGTYTAVTDDELTEAEIAAFVATAGVKSTAVFNKLGTVKTVCYDNTVTTTSWVDGETCKASTESYKIQLKDDDCDGSRLTELQAAYPDLTIEAGVPTGKAEQSVTLTGTSGTANVNVGGVDYLATFDTDLTTTAANFVTTHAASILAATGSVVTADSGVLTFNDDATNFATPSITNVSGDLAGTVGAIDFLTTAGVGGCQRVFSTQVVTNVVCEECDDIFLDNFVSEAPQPFDFTEWELIPAVADENAKMGVRLTGKVFKMTPTEATVDSIPFYETSTRLSASGGYLTTTSPSFDPIFNDIFSVVRTSRAQDRDNLGYHLRNHEEASRYYFDGEQRHKNNLFAKTVLGEESVLDYTKQYVSYEVEILDNRRSQGVGRSSDMGTSYIIWAEFGRHEALEDIINNLAVASGFPTVQISAE